MIFPLTALHRVFAARPPYRNKAAAEDGRRLYERICARHGITPTPRRTLADFKARVGAMASKLKRAERP